MIELRSHVVIAEVRCRHHREMIGELRIWVDDNDVAYDDSPVFLKHDRMHENTRKIRQELGDRASERDDRESLHTYIVGEPWRIDLIRSTFEGMARIPCWCRRCASDVFVSTAALRAVAAERPSGRKKNPPTINTR